jgi:hypothetical protein
MCGPLDILAATLRGDIQGGELWTSEVTQARGNDEKIGEVKVGGVAYLRRPLIGIG